MKQRQSRIGIIGPRRAFTLIEVMVVIVLIGIAMAGICSAFLFFISQVRDNIELLDMRSQLNYAIEDVRLRLPAAQRLKDYFIASGSEKRSSFYLFRRNLPLPGIKEFRFQAEENSFQVTPDDLSDNAWYAYYVGNDGEFVLAQCNKKPDGSLDNDSPCNPWDAEHKDVEALIDGRYSPQVYFWRPDIQDPLAGGAGSPSSSYVNLEPDMLMVSIRITHPKDKDKKIEKGQAVRLWFINALKD